MIRLTLNLIRNFVLHIQINTINLAYTRRLPRPYKSNWISRQIRKLFETKWIQSFIGANLAMAMVALPTLSHQQTTTIFEPSISVAQADIIASDTYTPQITTKPTEFVNPVPHLRYVGQEYHPGHYALDLNSYVGDPVLAFTAGRVSLVEEGTLGYGRHIIIDHGHGLTSLYAHLKSFQVIEGDIVDPGQQIGQIGMTGWTTGPHLHFEVYDDGIAQNPRNYLEIK